MADATDSPAGSTEDLPAMPDDSHDDYDGHGADTAEEAEPTPLPPNTSPEELWQQLLREQAANATLQRQIDNERRLRREAEDIIDERQDEVSERDAALRRMRYEKEAGKLALAQERHEKVRLAKALEAAMSTGVAPKRRTSPDVPVQSEKTGKVKDSDTTATPKTPSKPPPTSSSTPSSSPFLSLVISPTPFLGPTKYDAGAAYAALIASTKSFVESQLAPVFALRPHDLEASVSASATVGTAMARTRSLLRLMNPRARMFLRLKGADSVHFNAILIEFLRRHVFAQPYGGIFNVAAGPVPLSPGHARATPAARTPTPRVMSKIEARLTDADALAEDLAVLLTDLESPSGIVMSPTASPSVRLPYPKGRSDVPDAPLSSPRQPPTPPPPRHGHSLSDSTVHQRTSPSSSSSDALPPANLHRESRLLRAQLIDRVLSASSGSSCPKPPSSAEASSLPPPPPTSQSAARLSALYRHMDARIYELAGQLAPLLLPLRLALAEVEAKQTASSSSSPDTIDRAKIYADLERAITSDLVRPAVHLAVHMQLGVHAFSVRWVAHDHDSPSLSVCEALGLDYKRIQFGGPTAANEAQYSFVFDVSPALFMTEVPLGLAEGAALKKPPGIIYAQGVLLQKGEVLTDKTFVHWLHETGSRAKQAAATPTAYDPRQYHAK